MSYLDQIRQSAFTNELQKIAYIEGYDQQPQVQYRPSLYTPRNIALGAGTLGAAALGIRYRRPISDGFKAVGNFFKGPVAKVPMAGVAPRVDRPVGAGLSSIGDPALRAKQQAAMNMSQKTMRPAQQA